MKKVVEDIYPLSPVQAGLLFNALYTPNIDTYFVQSIFELKGQINLYTLRLALQSVSNHHPILRTGFVWKDGECQA